MIDRKKNAVRYLVHQSQHTMGPKVSVLLWLERRRPAQSERHIKSNTSMVLRGGFFQVVEVVQTQRYFKFIISASHCQQLGLYSKCYTVCDFTLH